MGTDVGPRDKIVVECVVVCAVFDYGGEKRDGGAVSGLSLVFKLGMVVSAPVVVSLPPPPSKLIPIE